MITIVKNNYRPLSGDAQFAASLIRTFEVKCGQCASVFRYQNIDVLQSLGGDTFVTCPCCGQAVVHDYGPTEKEVHGHANERIKEIKAREISEDSFQK